MPKYPTPAHASSSGSSSNASAPAPAPAILKRNQACHQCRRRKLKCNAQRPCSTCVRSHANAVAIALPGQILPPHPECTYDDLPDSSSGHEPLGRSRVERLEHKISELEGMVREKDQALAVQAQQLQLSLAYTQQIAQQFAQAQEAQQALQTPVSPAAAGYYLTPTSPTSITQTTVFSSMHTVHSPASTDPFPAYSQDLLSSLFSPTGSATSPSLSSPTMTVPPSDTTGSQDSTGQPPTQIPVDPLVELLWPSWPARLPPPDMLQHLVDIFFASHPHSNRLVHRTSFLSSLSLPPTHPNFPKSTLLHAICAFSSIFSHASDNAAPSVFNINDCPSHVKPPEQQANPEFRKQCFGEMHVRFALELLDHNTTDGPSMFAGLQALCVLAWFYYCQAAWVDVWVMTGRALRLAIPLGLNSAPTHGALLRSYRPPSILPQPASRIEEELRVNVFWLAYSLERWQAASSGWAMTLDDEDVSQVLPLKLEDYENGKKLCTETRQRLQTQRLLTTHPPELTDSYTLYLKSTILLSKVKVWSTRFRSKYFASQPPSAPWNTVFMVYGAARLSSDSGVTEEENPPRSPVRVDPRDNAAFQALDSLINSFKNSFPKELKHPVRNGIVDPDLYVASLVPHVATIMLHDPHADFSATNCTSAKEMVTAARAIMELIYMICNTSFDLMLLHHVASFTWFVAGKVLISVLKVKLDAGDDPSGVAALRADLEIIRLALERIGERMPLGCRQATMLSEIMLNELGAQAFPNDPFTGGSGTAPQSTPAGSSRPSTASSNPGVHMVEIGVKEESSGGLL